MSAQRNILLVSNSTLHGGGYLQHCEAELRELLDGVERLVFVPYALADHDGYTAAARARFAELGIEVVGIHEGGDPRAAVEAAQAVFVGGGNTFRLLKRLQDLGLVELLRERVLAGMPYVGSSAGSNVACRSIHTTNDMPIVHPRSLEALRLVPFNLNPHYLDPDPASSHMGETREERILQFHEEQEAPVLGLREGASLRVTGDRAVLCGTRGARLFLRGEKPRELVAGDRLDELLRE